MRMIFVNLPVNDLEASKAFFGKLGFSFNPDFTDETAACMVIEENIFAMLLTHAKFREFINGDIADANRATEVLVALSGDSREQVSDFKAKALEAGARPWKPDIDFGSMYGISFQDLDGHVWECMWMDMAAQQPPADAAVAG